MSRRGARERLNIALLFGVAVLACVWLMHVPGMGAGMAYPAPGVFVFLLLWLGRYPGQKSILALMRRMRPRHGGAIRAGNPRVASRMPRGGRLLATALAGRAPPRAGT
jgi:hypothetical protein